MSAAADLQLYLVKRKAVHAEARGRGDGCQVVQVLGLEAKIKYSVIGSSAVESVHRIRKPGKSGGIELVLAERAEDAGIAEGYEAVPVWEINLELGT